MRNPILFNHSMMSRLFLCAGIGLARVSGAADAEATACGHHDYPPWNWQHNDQIIGVCAEAASTLFARAGVQLDLSFVGPWKRCQQQIRLGKIDVNICAFRNPKRENYSTFIATPMGFNEIAVFVPPQPHLRFAAWPDLAGKAVGVVRGVSMGKAFDDFLKQKTKLSLANNYTQLFKMLYHRRLDAVPFGRHSGRTYIKALGLEDSLRDVKTPVLTGSLYFSMGKHSKHLDKLAAVEKQLQSPDYPAWLDTLLTKYTDLYASLNKDK